MLSLLSLLAVAGVSGQRYLTEEEMEADPFHNKAFYIQAEGPKCGNRYLSFPHGGEPTTNAQAGHCEIFQITIASYDETLPEGSGGPYKYSLRSDCAGQPYFGFDRHGKIEVGRDRWPGECQQFWIEESQVPGKWLFRSVCFGNHFLGVWRDFGVLKEPRTWVETPEAGCGYLTVKEVEWDFEIRSTPEIDAEIPGQVVSFQGDCGKKWYLSLKDGSEPGISTVLTDCEKFEVERASDDDLHMSYYLRSMCGERRYLSINHDHEITSNDRAGHCEMIKVTTRVIHYPDPTLIGDCGSTYVPFIGIFHDGTLRTVKKPDHCERLKMVVHDRSETNKDDENAECDDSAVSDEAYAEKCFALTGQKEECKAALCKVKKKVCAPNKRLKCRKLDDDEEACCRTAGCRFKNGRCNVVRS